jgi:hypothetical protein
VIFCFVIKLRVMSSEGTSGPDRHQGGGVTLRAPTFSQAPQAVRSARGRWGKRTFPSTAFAGRTLQADECHAIGLTADVHRPGNVSGTAAARAVLRIHRSPSIAKSFSLIRVRSAIKVNSVTKDEQVLSRLDDTRHSYTVHQHRLSCRQLRVGADGCFWIPYSRISLC